MTFLAVHMDLDAPAIGSGRRVVFLASAGRKWARIWCPYTLRSARLPLRDWERLAQTARPARVKLKTIDRTARTVPVPSKRRRTVQAALKAMREAARANRKVVLT